MTTLTLNMIAAEMSDYNRAAAPGSECAAWGDFVEDCFSRYQTSPWAAAAAEIEPSQDFADYWISVASGKNPDYDPETGSRIDAVV